MPPLALPRSPTTDAATSRFDRGLTAQYEAVRLFIERAQAVKADFRRHERERAGGGRDLLPAGWAAAGDRAGGGADQAVPARRRCWRGWSSRLTLLTGGARDLPARQQTIRNTIDWSYDLLDAGEQTLFARLGVFVGGCTLEAAEAVCNADGDLPMDVVDGLAALVDKSLLRQDEELDGEPRFVMLETIREYALEQLEASGEAEALRRQHADYFLALAETAEPWLRFMQPEREPWMARLGSSMTTCAPRWNGSANVGKQNSACGSRGR